MKRIDLSKLLPPDRIRGDDDEDTELLRRMHKDASEYLASFPWCEDIVESFMGLGVGGVVAVFLFHIRPAIKNVDEWLWVLVGDLPPAYLVTDDCPDPVTALETYVREMRLWVARARNREPLTDVIPVNAPPTPEYAKMLESRLEFIERKILPSYCSGSSGCEG